jgi:hypothetical protein
LPPFDKPGGAEPALTPENLMAGKLLIINPQHYMEVPFDQQVTIGRDVFNSLSLQDGEISRSHAIIFDQGDQPYVKDLNSRNGVYVNGDKVSEQALEAGDEIIVGSSIIFFNPPEKMDIEQALSRRGEQIFARRAASAPSRYDHPVTVFTCAQMEGAIQDLFKGPDETNFFSLPNAMSLLQAFRDMDHAGNSPDLFRMTLKRALGFIGGKRGVIMETDTAKEKLKVRSIRPRTSKAGEIEISQQVLRVVLRAERCVFCPNVAEDNRFAKMAGRANNPVHSFLASPIIMGSTCFGFIYLESEDESCEYDYVDLRSLFFIASHLAALLSPRETHFVHVPELESSHIESRSRAPRTRDKSDSSVSLR